MKDNFIDLNLKVSSNIAGAKYDYEAKELVVFFGARGTVSKYKYHNIPKELAFSGELAESTGKFFCANIRPYPELYPYERIR